MIYNPNNDWTDHIKHAIRDGIKFGNNYYIPITRSLLLSSVPFEDTIIYTTRIEIKTLNRNILTDAIITNNGLITIVPYSVNNYIGWDNVSFRINNSFKFSGFNCKLHRVPHYESKKQFKTRSKNFKATIYQLRNKFF